jgi:hypothetical protein
LRDSIEPAQAAGELEPLVDMTLKNYYRGSRGDAQGKKSQEDEQPTAKE